MSNNSIRLTFSRLGASVTSVTLFLPEKSPCQVALSPMAFMSASKDPSLAGRTIGPVCGRIRNGEVPLGNNCLQLEQNEDQNHLHGGTTGTAGAIWAYKAISSDRISFSHYIKDGECGFPGNRSLEVIYSLLSDGLRVDYLAHTDKDTPFCLTSHLYWDLTGKFDGSALQQMLTVAADRFVWNRNDHCPEKVLPVQDTPFDFLTPAIVSQQLTENPENEQFLIARGFNNAFIFSSDLVHTMGWNAVLQSEESHIQMKMVTDMPALVFYSGGFLDAQTPLQNGVASPGCALALEAQEIPDPWHLQDVSCETSILHAGKNWHRFIEWHFSEF